MATMAHVLLNYWLTLHSTETILTSLQTRNTYRKVRQAYNILILGVCILLRVWDQGESVFRLHNFNILNDNNIPNTTDPLSIQ
jgi:hypothetical protein